MSDASVDIRLNRPQWLAYQALRPGHTVTIPWGRGVGKSWFMRCVMYLLVAKWDGVLRTNALKPFRGVRIIMLMPTLKQFKDVHSLLLLQELAEDFAFLGAKVDRTTWRVTFPGGSWIQPFPAAEHNSRTSRGLRGDVALVDEGDDVEPSVYNSVVRPWFSEPWSLNMRLLGGTPRRGRHGLLYQLHKAGLSAKPDQASYFSFHATWRDAPENVSASVVAEAKANTPAPIYKREWECDFDAAEGLVYDLFDERFHVRLPPERFYKYIAGVDWGYADPGVMLAFGIAGHGRDAQAYLLEEVYETGKVIDFWAAKADEFRAKYPGIKFHCDPSQPASIRSLGAGAVGANNKIDQGVACVADKLFQRGDDDRKWSRLYVHPNCANTIREFGEYRRKKDPRDPDRYLDTIEDKNNHCLVAGTEVQTSAGPKPIESVKAGDYVATRDGWCPVEWSGMTIESAPIWRVELSSGRDLEGTADHRVWTQNRGWIRVDALRYGDILLPWEPVAVHVVASQSAGRSAPVYDLTVAQAHEFFANGVLVHNSMDAARYALFAEFGLPEVVRHEWTGSQYG